MYCRSSSGDCVDLLRRTIYIATIVSDCCITYLAMVGGFLSKALLALLVYLEEETFPSAVCCGSGVPLLLYLASSPPIHDFVEVVLLFMLLQLLLLLVLLLFLFFLFLCIFYLFF